MGVVLGKKESIVVGYVEGCFVLICITIFLVEGIKCKQTALAMSVLFLWVELVLIRYCSTLTYVHLHAGLYWSTCTKSCFVVWHDSVQYVWKYTYQNHSPQRDCHSECMLAQSVWPGESVETCTAYHLCQRNTTAQGITKERVQVRTYYST